MQVHAAGTAAVSRKNRTDGGGAGNVSLPALMAKHADNSVASARAGSL